MDVRERLTKLLQAESQSVSELQEIIAAYDQDRVVRENEALKNTLARLQSENTRLSGQFSDASAENARLRVALNEQILNERLNILKISRRKMETYFQNAENGENNRLFLLELQFKNKLQEIRAKLSDALMAEEALLKEELDQLTAKVSGTLAEKRKALAEERQQWMTELDARCQQFGDEPLDAAAVQRRLFQNNLERLLGLSWTNKLGIFLIVVATVMLVKYGYNNWFHPGPYAKGVLLLVLGLGFLGGGELLNRKQQNTFALGLVSGGIAILYITAFSSYFFLEILDLQAAALFAVLVTLGTVALSLRYNSRGIAVFGLIGGYLPFFAYVFNMDLTVTAVYIAMAYVFLLNAMLLAVSLVRKWQIVSWVGLLLSIPVMLYLISGLPRAVPSLLFVMGMFALYLAIILGYAVRFRTALAQQEIFLLALNTTVSCASAYWILSRAGWDDYRGFLAVGFALLYIGLGRLLERIVPQERLMRTIFYLTALTFVTLVVPFQFGKVWLSIGWTIEAVFLVIYGLRLDSKLMQWAGWAVLGLSYAAFVIAADSVDPMHHYRFALLTVGMAAVIAAHRPNSDGSSVISVLGRGFNLAKYFILAHILCYAVIESSEAFDAWVRPYIDWNWHLVDFYAALTCMAAAVLVCYGMHRLKLTQDRIVAGAVCVVIAVIDLVILNLATDSVFPNGAFGPASVNDPVSWITLVLLIGLLGFVFATLRKAVLAVLSRFGYNLEWYPVILAIYLIIAIIIVRRCQFFWIPSSHFVESFAMMILSLALVVYGLKQYYVYIRRFGLGLALLATAKLVFLDLSGLSSLTRIFAFFGFGVVFLAISYIYQKLESQDRRLNLTPPPQTGKEENE